MKKTLLISLLAFLLGGYIFADTADYRNPSALESLVESGRSDYLLLDVRTAGEFAAGHIPGSVNIPYDTLPAALPAGTAKDMTIIVYCRSGNRSGQAARALKKAGYTNLHDFGGLYRWKGDLEK